MYQVGDKTDLPQRVPPTVKNGAPFAERDCVVCDQPFLAPRWLISKYKTCSKRCGRRLRHNPDLPPDLPLVGDVTELPQRELPPSYTTVSALTERECIVCAKRFLAPWSTSYKTCSDDCYKTLMRTGYPKTETATCPECEELFQRAGRANGRKFCSPACQANFWRKTTDLLQNFFVNRENVVSLRTMESRLTTMMRCYSRKDAFALSAETLRRLRLTELNALHHS